MNLQVLLLMAGPSDAFQEAGYHYPKNLVEIDGLPLIQRTLGSLHNLIEQARSLTCVLPKSEDRKHHTGAVVQLLQPLARVVAIEGTAGAACSAMLALTEIDFTAPLAIINGDQILETDLVGIVEDFQSRALDGGIVVFEAVHPRWSFVRCDDDGWVVEAAEKRPISRLATAGVYYFKQADYFFDATKEMIRKDAQVEGRFYICPAYNEMILKQMRIGVSKISKSAYWSLATPDGVRAYENNLQKNNQEIR